MCGESYVVVKLGAPYNGDVTFCTLERMDGSPLPSDCDPEVQPDFLDFQPFLTAARRVIMNEDVKLKNEIRDAAASRDIDLSDPVNAFTVWGQSTSGLVYCGGRRTLDAALFLAHQHVQMKNMVILSANPQHGLTRVPDDDRLKGPPADPGSGS
jgi:hypothetical protein